MREDPPRLLDSGADPRLREVLRTVSTSTPSAAQLEGLALKVGAATAAHGAAAHGAQGLLGKSMAVKLTAVLVVAGSATWLAWNANHTTPAARPTPPLAPSVDAVGDAARDAARDAPASTAPVAKHGPAKADALSSPLHSEAATQPSTTERERQPAAKHDTPMAAPIARPHRAPLASSRTKPLATAAVASDGTQPAAATPAEPRGAPTPTGRQGAPSELSLLSRAQGLLARDPDAALDLIDEHARAYPNGQFSEEREALAIDAALRAGRQQDARARARAFMQRYPTSPHRERVEAALR